MEHRHFTIAFGGFVTGVFLTVLVLPASQENATQASEDKAKAVLQKVCVSCHEMDTVTATRRTRAGWEGTVEDMVSRGAEGSDEEIAEVVTYLTKYFGQINVNTATVEQLQEFLGLTGKEAQTITAFRDRNGAFKDFEQLTAVPDVNAGKLQEKRSLIAFSM